MHDFPHWRMSIEVQRVMPGIAKKLESTHTYVTTRICAKMVHRIEPVLLLGVVSGA